LYNKRLINNKYVILDSPLLIEEKKQLKNENIDSDNRDIESEKILKKANEDAKLIVFEAERQAKEIIEGANVEAQQIFEMKKKEADFYFKNTCEETIKNFNEEINNKLMSLDENINNYMISTEELIISIIKDVVEKYLKNDFFNKPEWFNEVILRLKEKISSFKKVLIRMNPKMVNEYGGFFESDISESFSIKEDVSLKNYQINVETEIGVYDIVAENFIQEIMDDLEVSFDENK